MPEPLTNDDRAASGWQTARPSESLTDEQIARITEAEADTPAGVLALLDAVERLREENEDAAGFVGTVCGLVVKLRGELPDGEDEHPGTWLEHWVDEALASNEQLRTDRDQLNEIRRVLAIHDPNPPSTYPDVEHDDDTAGHLEVLLNDHQNDLDTIDRLRAENTALGVRRQEQHARAETAEEQLAEARMDAEGWRSEHAQLQTENHRLRQARDRADNEATRSHDERDEAQANEHALIQTFDQDILANAGDEWDSDEPADAIALRYVRHLEAREEALTDLIEAVRAMADEMDGSGYYPATAWAFELRQACDTAAGGKD